mmetsp:Transcript_43478/g.115407  ORF Transcript_43478/g.115407 Transcript_43478/m.115407 type:complete len:304 (-) Transcript_43478:1210-2121(-)
MAFAMECLMELVDTQVRLVGVVLELLEQLSQEPVLRVQQLAQLVHRAPHLRGLVALQRLLLRPRSVVAARAARVHADLLRQHARRVILVEHDVAEVVVADLPVLVVVEVPHHLLDLRVGEHHVELLERLLELAESQDAVVVRVEAPEDVAHLRVGLQQRGAQLVQHRLEVERKVGHVGLGDALLGVLVHVDDQELVVVHLDRLPRHEILGREQLARLLVHVHALLQELASHDAHVALRRLVDGQLVVHPVETDDEDAIHVLDLRVRELGLEPQHLALVLEQLHQVLPGRLRDQVRHGAHGVFP